MGDLKISRPTGSYPPSSAQAIQVAGKLMLGEGCKATARSFGREPLSRATSRRAEPRHPGREPRQGVPVASVSGTSYCVWHEESGSCRRRRQGGRQSADWVLDERRFPRAGLRAARCVVGISLQVDPLRVRVSLGPVCRSDNQRARGGKLVPVLVSVPMGNALVCGEVHGECHSSERAMSAGADTLR